MVAQRLISSPPAADDTLATLWRSVALRMSRLGIAGLAGAGIAAVAICVVRSSWPIVAALGIVVTAFAAYAALIAPRDDRDRYANARRVAANVASTIAALAALMAGLLALAAIFGGSIEVMRR